MQDDGQLCLLGLGASIGKHLLGNDSLSARQRLQAASLRLQQLPASAVLACSNFYHSRAWGNQRAGQYLNAAVLLQTRLLPLTLLKKLLAIEFACGRRRHRRRWNKRAVDIDMLLYGHAHIHAAGLQIPHVWLWQREFVLLPAAELRAHLPLNLSYQDWHHCIEQRQRRTLGYHLTKPLRILSQNT